MQIPPPKKKPNKDHIWKIPRFSWENSVNEEVTELASLLGFVRTENTSEMFVKDAKNSCGTNHKIILVVLTSQSPLPSLEYFAMPKNATPCVGNCYSMWYFRGVSCSLTVALLGSVNSVPPVVFSFSDLYSTE